MQKKTIIFACLLLIAAVLSYALLHKRYAGKAFVLMYHRIAEYNGGLRGLSVSPGTFDRQLGYLRRKGFRTIGFSELVRILKEKKGIPEKVFVITFDDGYENNYISALPLLKKYGFTATVFLNSRATGGIYRYPRMPEADRHLSKEQILKMSGAVDFGSHTATHPDLTALGIPGLEKELRDSKTAVTAITGKPAEAFCYPFGKYDSKVLTAVKKYYAGACTTLPGLVSVNTDPYAIPRFAFKETKAMGMNDLFASRDFYLKVFLGM